MSTDLKAGMSLNAFISSVLKKEELS